MIKRKSDAIPYAKSILAKDRWNGFIGCMDTYVVHLKEGIEIRREFDNIVSKGVYYDEKVAERVLVDFLFEARKSINAQLAKDSNYFS